MFLESSCLGWFDLLFFLNCQRAMPVAAAPTVSRWLNSPRFGPSWMKTTVSFVPDLSPNYSSCVDFSLVESSFEFFDPKPLYLQIHCPIAMANIANIEIIALGKTPMPVARRTPQRIMGMPMYSTLLATRFLMKSLYPKQLCK